MKKTLVALAAVVVIAGGITATVVLRALNDAPANGAGGVGTSGLTENQKIEMLIESLRALDGATFIRNGREHTVDEAVEHLTKKWRWKEDDIETAGDFIDIAATKSSMSGEYYTIRLGDGRAVRSCDWFRERLAEMGDR